MKDPTEFRQRFAAWKNGEKVYKYGLPTYGGGKGDVDFYDDVTRHIINKEGFLTTPKDIGDGKITIGSGLTQKKYIDQYKRNGNKWSLKENYIAVKDTARGFENSLRGILPEYDQYPAEMRKALIDIIYNIGEGGLKNSPKFLAAMRSRNWNEAKRQMDWDNSDPLFGNGARKRNAERAAMFDAGLLNWSPVGPVEQMMENKPVFVPQPVFVPLTKNNTDYSIETMTSPTIPLMLNSRNSGDSPLYGGSDYSFRMPSIKEVMERLLFLGLPRYGKGKPGWNLRKPKQLEEQEERRDNTNVVVQQEIKPIKRNLAAEATRKHAQEVVISDNRTSYQKQRDYKEADYLHLQYERTKNELKAQEGFENLMRFTSPSTYVEAATGLDLGTVGRLATDAVVFGLPGFIKNVGRKAISRTASPLTRLLTTLNNTIGGTSELPFMTQSAIDFYKTEGLSSLIDGSVYAREFENFVGMSPKKFKEYWSSKLGDVPNLYKQRFLQRELDNRLTIAQLTLDDINNARSFGYYNIDDRLESSQQRMINLFDSDEYRSRWPAYSGRPDLLIHNISNVAGSVQKRHIIDLPQTDIIFVPRKVNASGSYSPGRHKIQVLEEDLYKFTPEHEFSHASDKGEDIEDLIYNKMTPKKSTGDNFDYYNKKSEKRARVMAALADMKDRGYNINNYNDILDYLFFNNGFGNHNVKSIFDNYDFKYQDLLDIFARGKVLVPPVITLGAYNKYAE